MPMYETLKFPASAMMVTRELIKIATFDLIPTEWVDEILWYFPEGDAFSLSFETEGLETRLLLQNIGLILYMISFNILYGLGHLLLLPTRKLGGFAAKTVAKMENYLYFNGSIRFYMEIFFDVCLVAALNLRTADWGTPFIAEQISNAFSVIFIVLICILPLSTTLLTCIKPNIWSNKTFENRCEAVYEGMDE